MGKTANLELNTTEMSDKISDFVGEYNSNMNMLDDLYGDVQDDASSALSTAQSAETKATAAQTAATNAVTTANSANTTAQSAVSTANSANTTAGQANTKADNAVATANTAKDTADEAKETAETASADVADKADVDGTYDSFTAGGAKQLLSTVYVDDNEPYNFRTAGGSADIGDRMYEEVVGGTVVWNQWGLDGTPEAIQSTYATMEKADGVATITLTQQASAGQFYVRTGAVADNYKNHVLLALFDTKTTSQASLSNFMFGWSAWTAYESKSVNTNVWTQVGLFAKGTDSRNSPNIYYDRDVSLSVGDTIEVKNLCMFDLTQMFGATIADAILALEQGTAGAGVAWFRKLFPKPYYAYNEGELMSVKAGSHDTVGFNAWDEETEAGGIQFVDGTVYDLEGALRTKNFIPVVGGMAYHVTTKATIVTSNMACFWYDADYNFLYYDRCGNATVNAPSNARYAKFYWSSAYGGTYLHDTSFHLAWDGERNGEYEPYEKHEYPLAELELRGILKLDANNQLYYDGDTYASDGTVTRKYGIVDLGTLNWDTSTANRAMTFGISSLIKLPASTALLGNYITSKNYQQVPSTSALAEGQYAVLQGASNNGSIVFYRSGTETPTGFFVYELATPTTETADTYVNPQVVDDFGTEEYVDYAVEAGDRDVAIPVGHNSQYMNNLRAKLEMAPDSPSGDGKYIVQQSNGENAYIPYTADGRLDAVEAKLPAPPSANGTYKLTATVSNNGVTYSWQS